MYIYLLQVKNIEILNNVYLAPKSEKYASQFPPMDIVPNNSE